MAKRRNTVRGGKITSADRKRTRQLYSNVYETSGGKRKPVRRRYPNDPTPDRDE